MTDPHARIAEISRRLDARLPAADDAPDWRHLRRAGDPPADDAALAPYIDHTLLKADASAEQVLALCDEARRHGFWSVCVNPSRVGLCVDALGGSGVRTITVVGFPLGATTSAAKAFEAREAVGAGAAEIDMVLNVGALKSDDLEAVLEDVRAVVAAAAPAPVKVILETGFLDPDELVTACLLARRAGAAFVKTSTGFGPGGATAADIELMRAAVGEDLGVKASGGVRTAEDARRMIAAGADRIGASASVAIVGGKVEAGKGGY